MNAPIRATGRLALLATLSAIVGLAGLILGSTSARAANVPNPCVSTVEQLHAALDLASENSEFDSVDGDIRIVVGTYAINNSYFQYGSAKSKTLDISGGWNFDCSKQIQDPRFTSISGLGSSKQLLVSNSAGDVSIRYLTFKGGKATSGGSALQMNTGGSVGQVILDYDIFTANTGGESVVDVGGSTLVQVDNNLFYANGADSAIVQVGNPAISGSTPKFSAVNNTFTQNTLLGTVNQAQIAVTLAATGTHTAICNNIIYGNSHDRIVVGGAGGVDLRKNIIGAWISSGTVSFGSATGNSYANPGFLSATDFRLQSSSPAIADGVLTPTGTPLPQNDLQGFPRTFGGAVDLGVYEIGDEIFRDGADF